MEEIFFHSHQSKIFRHLDIEFIITSRLNGFSQKPLIPYENSLNLGYHVHDDPTHVAKNRNKVSSLFHPAKPLLWVNQIHGNQVLSTSIAPQEKEILLGDGDGIYCNQKDQKALIMMADCAGIFIYDSFLHRFLLLHSGRAGAIKKIMTTAIHQYKFDPKGIYIYISPHIHSCCYEIHEDLIPSLQDSKDAVISRNHKFFFDITHLLKTELHTLCIPKNHIEISPICTCCSSAALFSYRRARLSGLENTGRFGILATLM